MSESETTEAVAEAAGVSISTVYRWSKSYKVLPAYVDSYGGRVGRTALWPVGSVEAAALVRRMLSLGLSFAQIRSVQANHTVDELKRACDLGREALLAEPSPSLDANGMPPGRGQRQ